MTSFLALHIINQNGFIATKESRNEFIEKLSVLAIINLEKLCKIKSLFLNKITIKNAHVNGAHVAARAGARLRVDTSLVECTFFHRRCSCGRVGASLRVDTSHVVECTFFHCCSGLHLLLWRTVSY